MKTSARPRKLTIDSLVVESFQTSSQPAKRSAELDSFDTTCGSNTVWYCGTGRNVCPGCL